MSARATRSQRLTGLLFIGAGINHFAIPRAYRQIVPPGFGDPQRLVTLSGVAEIAGGLGVFVPRTRRLSGLGLIALLVAVFPANLYMARNPAHFPRIPRWALYVRLPLQPLMVWGVWRATRHRGDREEALAEDAGEPLAESSSKETLAASAARGALGESAPEGA